MPEIPNISFALNLPPEKAIEYFRSKGYAISFRWRDVWKEAQAKAFTVAGATRLDVLDSIRKELDSALAEGKTFRQFKDELEPTLKKLGWWGKTEIVDPVTGEVRDIDVTPHRLRNIYRTNMQTSYMAGRYKFQKEIAEQRPYWKYIAIIDSATRPSHEAKNNTVIRHDDPWWDTNYPPNGWGCRCRVTTLSERALEREGLTASEGSNIENIAEEGWDYNPGKTSLFDATEIDPNKFPDQRNWKDFGLPDLRDIPDSQKLSAELLKEAKSEDLAHEQIAQAFGVSRGNPISYIQSPVENVAIHYEKLRHMAESRTNKRERYVNFAKKAVEDPLEVYLTLFNDGKYRKQYIAVFDASKSILVSVVLKKDGSLFWNFFQAKDKDMNKNRKGDALLYKKQNP